LIELAQAAERIETVGAGGTICHVYVSSVPAGVGVTVKVCDPTARPVKVTFVFGVQDFVLPPVPLTVHEYDVAAGLLVNRNVAVDDPSGSVGFWVMVTTGWLTVKVSVVEPLVTIALGSELSTARTLNVCCFGGGGAATVKVCVPDPGPPQGAYPCPSMSHSNVTQFHWSL